MPEQNLNPDALSSNPALFKVASTHHFHGNQCLCGFVSPVSRQRTEHIMYETLSALPAQPVLTDDEWREFQAIPDQGYSHRAWINARIAERMATAQPDTVTSVEELVMTRAGLALANTAFGEGLSAGIRACNAAHRRQPFKKPVSPYSAPLLAMIKADRPVEG